MKKLMEEYAGSVTAVFTAMGVFGILFGPAFGSEQTLNGYLGSIAMSVLESETGDKTGTAFGDYINTKVSNVQFQGCHFVKSGSDVLVTELVDIKDSIGNTQALMVMNCWDEYFQSTTGLTVKEKKLLCFHREGIYWVEICAADGEGYNQSWFMKLYANGG